MGKKHIVVLTNDQRRRLQLLLSQGTASPRTSVRAQILLLADAGTPDSTIAATTKVSVGLVERVRKRFAEDGWEAAIEDRQRSGFRRNLSANGTSTVVAHGATTGSTPERAWVLKLVEDKFVEFKVYDTHVAERVGALASVVADHRRPLEWIVPAISPTFVWRMEDVLDLYAEPYNPRRPQVCVDERPYHLVHERHSPSQVHASAAAQRNGHYRRDGTCYLFMMFQPHRAWRHVTVAQRHSASEVARCLQELVDVHFPEAELIRIVSGNLNGYTPAVLYESLPPAEAQRIAARLEWHYTPTQGNWLNMAQIELSILLREQLDPPIATTEAVRDAVACCVDRRNREHGAVHWQLTTPEAREKLEHLYARSAPSAAGYTAIEA